MPEPLFTQDERVDPTPGDSSTLPVELQGKSAEEVAQFYQQREAQLRREINRPAPAVPPAKRADVSAADLWADPKASVESMINKQAPSRDEFDRASAFVQTNMVEVAQMLMRQKHPDFDKYANEIGSLMAKTERWMQADLNTWQTAYTYVKGTKVDQLVADATARATMGAEPVNPASITPAPPRVLRPEELFVCEHMGISPDSYRKAEQNIVSGAWPMTMNNQRRTS